MENIIGRIIEMMVAFLTSKETTLVDKFLILLMSLVVLPYTAYMVKHIHKFVKKIVELLVELLGGKHSLAETMPFNIKRNKLIQSVLEKLVFECSATRAYIVQLHNGGHNVSGVPFIKFSMTNEWCPISVERESPSYRDVPLGVFSGLTYALIKDKAIYCPDIEHLKKYDTSSYAIYKNKGVKSVYISGIFNLRETLIGMVIVECYEPNNMDEDEIFMFEKNVGILSGLVLCKDCDDPEECCAPDNCF